MSPPSCRPSVGDMRAGVPTVTAVGALALAVLLPGASVERTPRTITTHADGRRVAVTDGRQFAVTDGPEVAVTLSRHWQDGSNGGFAETIVAAISTAGSSTARDMAPGDSPRFS